MSAQAAPVRPSYPTPAVRAYGASLVRTAPAQLRTLADDLAGAGHKPRAAASTTPSGAPSTGPHPPGTAGTRPATPLRLLVLIALLGGTFLLARRARRSN